MIDLAKLNGSSGVIKYRGGNYDQTDGLKVAASIEGTEIPIDGIGADADTRDKTVAIKLTWTPSGEWTTANIRPLYPYLAMPVGRFVIPVLPVSIDTATDVLTCGSHGFIPGDRIMIGIRAGGTLPTLSAGQVNEDEWYFVSTPTADTIKVHLSAADALANTNPMNFSTTGTGVKVVGQFPFDFYSEDGQLWRFHNCYVSKQPDFECSTEKTPFGEVEVTVLIRNRKNRSDENSFLTLSDVVFPGYSGVTSAIPTQAQSVAWADQRGFTPEAISLEVGDEGQITVDTTGLLSGQMAYLNTTGTLPVAAPAINPSQPYYIHLVSAGVITLHRTNAEGISGANPIEPTNVGTGMHFLTLDNASFTLMEAEAGVSVSFPITIEERVLDGSGPVNGKLTKRGAEVKFIPVTGSAAALLGALKIQGAGSFAGRSMATGAKPLAIFSAGMYVRVDLAALMEAELARNMKDGEAREITFKSTSRVVAGVLKPVAVIGTAYVA